MLSFDRLTARDMRLIEQITDRAVAIYKRAGRRSVTDKLSVMMDLSACHANGCPLYLDAMLTADDYNLMHDVSGIHHHLDRDTGRLTGCFLPRFAQRQHMTEVA